ncbi:MAG: Gfo/Idh/MocA family protein [Pseudanabaenaceae cyanobacterium]
MIGVGILGTGFGKSVHIPALRSHPYFKVVAIWGRTKATAQQVAEAEGIPYYSDNWQELINLPSVQVVSVTTPPFLHFAQASAALSAGKHVLLEKPVTLNVTEAIALQQLAEDRNLIIGVDFEFRCVPEWRYFHDLLQEGIVGTPRLITIEWLVAGRANPTRQWNWYSQKALGGGALGALASHSFDYIHWLFGKVAGLSAQLVTTIPTRPDSAGNPQPVDSEDTCSLFLRLVDGTPINLVISTVTYHGAGHWLAVYGDRGTLKLGSANLKDYIHGFQILQATPDRELLAFTPIPDEYKFTETFRDGRIAPVRAIYDRLANSILNGTPMIPSIQEGIASQRLIDLAQLSAQTGSYIPSTQVQQLSENPRAPS